MKKLIVLLIALSLTSCEKGYWYNYITSKTAREIVGDDYIVLGNSNPNVGDQVIVLKLKFYGAFRKEYVAPRFKKIDEGIVTEIIWGDENWIEAGIPDMGFKIGDREYLRTANNWDVVWRKK